MTAQKLREARQALGLSQKDAARIFGYPLRTWQAFETKEGVNARAIKPNLIASLKFYEMLPKGKKPL